MSRVREITSAGSPRPAEPRTVAELEERYRQLRAEKRAERAARTPRRPSEAPPAEPSTDRRLGRDRGYASTAGQSADGGRRGARYEARETLWEVSSRKGVRHCGKTPVSGGVTTALDMRGKGSHLGLMHCGLIWVCPVCSAKIRAVRADTLADGSTAWCEAGHAVALMTLTIRHYARERLRDLVKKVAAAWRRAFTGRPWKTMQDRYGITGYARAMEVTHGEANGWHVHFHVLLFVDRGWSQDRADAFRGEAAARWADACQAVGAYRPSDARGVRVDVLGKGTDPADMARYVMKGQDGKRAAFELADPDTKRGKNGHRTPFEILADFVATADADDLDLWHAYEEAMTGQRALVWSRGMRDRLAELVELDDRTDAEIVEEEADGMLPIALIPAETWKGHVVRHRGRALALLHAAEDGGQPALRALVASWGLQWGRDVLDPPDPVAGPQAAV